MARDPTVARWRPLAPAGRRSRGAPALRPRCQAPALAALPHTRRAALRRWHARPHLLRRRTARLAAVGWARQSVCRQRSAHAGRRSPWPRRNQPRRPRAPAAGCRSRARPPGPQSFSTTFAGASPRLNKGACGASIALACQDMEVPWLSANVWAAAQLVEARLAALLDDVAAAGAPERLVDAMRHGTLGGGKRFRPFLVLEAAGTVRRRLPRPPSTLPRRSNACTATR